MNRIEQTVLGLAMLAVASPAFASMARPRTVWALALALSCLLAQAIGY